MPELPEVETVKNILNSKIKGVTIKDVKLHYKNIIEYPTSDIFIKKIINQKINDIQRKGKWLMFELDNYYLLSHLRMEGKYNIKDKEDTLNKHEHVTFVLSNNKELRYQDVRKFGRMYLYTKEEVYDKKPLNELGKEPWDKELTKEYLKSKYKNKKLPIKTVILDQTIITGIGNIYADEILFLSNITPLKETSLLSDKDLDNIINNTKIVLEKAIKLGGTTIRTFSAGEVHGRFQNELNVHGKVKEPCTVCGTLITKIKVNGRGTYYCTNCQK
jgi:formamidopyrimidine-DNA glycosylase